MRLAAIVEHVQRPLFDQLMALRPQFVAAAQAIYDEWDQELEDNGGGICDDIAEAMASIIVQHVVDVGVQDGGHDGDDHAYIVAFNATEAYAVDIDPYLYETGGGYNWQKTPGVQFNPDYISIAAMPRNWVEAE
jgi:hypothetical protein